VEECKEWEGGYRDIVVVGLWVCRRLLREGGRDRERGVIVWYGVVEDVMRDE
jgi:hypothetical protein